MNEPIVDRRNGRAPDGIDRRRRKQDPLRIVLSCLAYVVYPLLLINGFIFMAIAGEEQKSSVATEISQRGAQIGGVTAPIQPAAADSAQTATHKVGRWVQVYAFLPIMAAGVVLGGAGIVLDRMRARRRSDSSLMTPLVLTLLSVVGLFVYFIVRGLMT